MNKIDVVRTILREHFGKSPKKSSATAFAPSNIALCKYWGKRDSKLNLLVTSSLSIALGDKGANVELKIIDEAQDILYLNGKLLDQEATFAKRLFAYLNLFRNNSKPRFALNIQSNIPIAAGLASSAAGFASVILALNELYQWQLSESELSILARLGSGSACRSIWQGFVEWHVGNRDDGLDSFGESLNFAWQDLCVGLLIFQQSEKALSSREAMQRTVRTSALYHAWPAKIREDLQMLKEAIVKNDFDSFGKVAESNALAMHATMLSAWPPINYSLPETLAAMQKIWDLRAAGLPLYFTQDAGPNLKLLFLRKSSEIVREYFPQVEIVFL